MRSRITPRTDGQGAHRQEMDEWQRAQRTCERPTGQAAVRQIRAALAITTEERLRRMNEGFISYAAAVLRNNDEQERPALEALAQRIAGTHELLQAGLRDLENPARRVLAPVRRLARQLSGKSDPPSLEGLFDEQLANTHQLLDYGAALVEEKYAEATAIDRYAEMLIEGEGRAHSAVLTAQALLPEHRERYERLLSQLGAMAKDDASYFALKQKARRTYWEGLDLSHARRLASTKERTLAKSQCYVEEVLERLRSYARNVELFVETARGLRDAVAHTKRGYFSVVESQRSLNVLREGMRGIGEHVEHLHGYLRSSDAELRALVASTERARGEGS